MDVIRIFIIGPIIIMATEEIEDTCAKEEGEGHKGARVIFERKLIDNFRDGKRNKQEGESSEESGENQVDKVFFASGL